MIRMVEMSVLLGIESRDSREFGTKKGRAMPRVPRAKSAYFSRAGGL